MGAQGTASLDFGAFPGGSDAYVDVTGQTGYTSANLVDAWLNPIDTADHLADEHLVETIRIKAKYLSAGSFRIHGVNTSERTEPLEPFQGLGGGPSVAQGDQQPTRGGQGTRIYGVWSVGWVWNVLVISFYLGRWL